MSEEKLYAVKNDKGLFLLHSFQGAPLWRVWGEMFANKQDAERVAHAENGHVVTLIEEPEKVVLTKEEAKIVKGAHNDKLPACHISSNSDDEELLMKAYVNGYNVLKEKKYSVKVPKKWCGDDKYYWAKEQDGTLIWDWLINKYWMTSAIPKKNAQQFTMTEIEYYGLQDCEKEEVTDDEQ